MKFNTRVDYYEILGVARIAAPSAIEAAFKRKVAELDASLHLDAQWLNQEMNRLLEAHRVLSDPRLRRAYDQAIGQPAEPVLKKKREAQPTTWQMPVLPPLLGQLLIWWWVLPLIILGLMVLIGLLVSQTITPADRETTTHQVTVRPPIATAVIPETLFAQMPVANNTDWQPVTETYEGVEMVLVPAGCFVMGEAPRTEADQAAQTVCFDAPFWIDRYEVTNEQFRDLGGMAERSSRTVDDLHPREMLAWDEAEQYCQQRGARLPTSAEWEYAARGVDSWLYPWGDNFIAERVVYRANSENRTAPVGSRAQSASWVGAVDMLGNVWEWVADHESTARLLRGGSMANNEVNLLSSLRSRAQLVEPWHTYGVRCAR